MSSVTGRHNDLSDYLRDLLRAYLSFREIGTVRSQPFVMCLDDIPSRREPDLMVILNDNPGQLTETAMVGPADICIEVVSLESTQRDHGDKLCEYEAGVVREYWTVDPLREASLFYRLEEDDDGTYRQVTPVIDTYKTPLLPDFSLTVSVLWQDVLPNMVKVLRSVEAMVNTPD
jgi:Uma2 family endonuclease